MGPGKTTEYVRMDRHILNPKLVFWININGSNVYFGPKSYPSLKYEENLKTLIWKPLPDSFPDLQLNVWNTIFSVVANSSFQKHYDEEDLLMFNPICIDFLRKLTNASKLIPYKFLLTVDSFWTEKKMIQ